VRTPTLAAGLLIPALAAAATGEHHGEHGAPTSAQWQLLGFTVANFVIFVALMVWLGRKPLRDFLLNRRRQLVDSMEEAARLKADAERLKREYERKAAALDKMRDDLIAEVRAIAETDRLNAVASAEQAAQRMRLDAERTARSDLERARQELRAEAARLAEELAREEVRRRLTDQDRRRLLQEFLSRVGRS
jgi:F-type H+-transporting ATPase subunit b